MMDGATGSEAFLLRLSDELRQLVDPAEIMAAACRVLGRQVGARRVAYFDVYDGEYVVERDYTDDGAISMAGRHPLASLGSAQLEAYRRGRIFTAGEVGVPILKDGQFVMGLVVHVAEPRQWTAGEIALVKETAERTWLAVERARAERALRDREERLRRMMNVPHVGVLTFDYTGKLLAANDAFLAMVGYSRDDLEAAPLTWRDFTPDEFVSASERVMMQLRETGQGGPYEKEYFRKDGSRIWMMFVASDMGDGTVVEYAVDISDRKRAEAREGTLLAEATAARAQAESANRAKDEFLATLSHELRTPMTAIQLWLAALRSGNLPGADVSRAIDAIAQSADHQSRLIEDLLDLSRLGASKLHLSLSPTDIASVVRQVVERVAPMMLAKRLVFEVDMAEQPTFAMLDARRLQQILSNLLENAIKFTPEGGTVTLRVHRRDEQVEVEVADTGAGIAPEQLPRLFERFWQVDMGETRQHMGLGIGLALAKQLVTLHGGTIEGHSEGRGRGASFRFRLPCPQLPGRPQAEATEAAASASRDLADVAVLIVEDDASTREAMRWVLLRAGASVIAVGTAEQALAALERDDRVVVVSDLGLPETSGLALIARIAERSRALGRQAPPSCAVSAHARDVDREQAIAAGFDMYLAKPVTGAQLLEAVADLRDIRNHAAEADGNG